MWTYPNNHAKEQAREEGDAHLRGWAGRRLGHLLQGHRLQGQNEGANDGSDDDSNWVPTKKVKQAAKKKVASKTASTQEEKAGLRRIRERRNEHVNLLAKQLQEEANNEDADDHAAGNANSLKDAKQLLLQEDADVQGSDDGDSDASLSLV